MAVTLGPHSIEERGWGIADPGRVRRRALVCIAGLCFTFAGLLVRLWYLQIVKGEAMLVLAQHNRLRHVPLPAPRGLILDRNNEVLATSRALHSVAVVPAALPSAKREPDERRAVLRTLGFLLGTSVDDIESQLQAAHERGDNGYDPVKVAVGVDLPTLTLIEENQWRLGSAVLVTDDIARSYPNGQLAAHVLGYTGLVTAEDIDASQAAEAAAQDSGRPDEVRALNYDDIIGKTGIERTYDAEVSGQPGSQVYEVDAHLRPIRLEGTEPEVPGHTLVLALDAKLQRAAEASLDAARNSGAVIALDPRNGEILALASRPAFDPNIFSLPTKQFRPAFQALDNDEKHPFVNRAVTARFPPGSTFKMVTAAAGLQQGSMTALTVRHCAGGIRMGRFFKCWQVHGDVDLFKALAQSCDVFFYDAALAMGDPESSGPTYLARIARQFGLGQHTNIDLPVDNAGLMPDPEWRRKINASNPALQRWYAGNTLNMAIGQGDVLATPLQMAMVTAAVANGGTLWQPHLMKQVLGADGKALRDFQPQGRSVGIDARYLALIRQGMRQVVTGGTGQGVNLPQVEVAGKTGSAEDTHHALPHAWFVCFAPYDNPTIAIACIVENSGHGADNAAPIAKAILEAEFPPGGH